VEKKRKTMKRSEGYPAESTTQSETTFRKEVLAAARKSAAAETRLADEVGEFTGVLSTAQEQSDYQELVALLQSLDGPEPLVRIQGYSRAVFPQRANPADTAED
jgi:hypothetical protein